MNFHSKSKYYPAILLDDIYNDGYTCYIDGSIGADTIGLHFDSNGNLDSGTHENLTVIHETANKVLEDLLELAGDQYQPGTHPRIELNLAVHLGTMFEENEPDAVLMLTFEDETPHILVQVAHRTGMGDSILM